ncbi:MAG: c-type cytochrome [Alphaproteobacteria bacterium]|nr:c-type cytochrome [Alphaproteobacteria bacterium]
MVRNRVWKWVGFGLGGIAVLAVSALAVFYFASQAIIARHYESPASNLRAANDLAAAARGRHFATVFGCADCHRHNLQGGFIPDFGISSRNLTRLAAKFSDRDFDRAVRYGLRPEGTSVSEYMPSDSFQYVADSDMDDIVAYLRSLKPAGEDIAFPTYGFQARIALLKGDAHMDRFWFSWQKPAMDLGPRYARGRQLAMAACGECHMTALTGAPALVPPPRPPDLSLVASYQRADFIRLMRTGKAAGNRELPLMSAAARARFSHFTDPEIGALYDYLTARGRKLTGASR